MFKKTIAVLISGKAGTGKGEAAKYLRDLAVNDKLMAGIFSFAGPLKLVAKSMGWDGQKDEKGRRLLQRLGTDVGREYDKEMWCKLLFQLIERWSGFPFDVIFIDDWRFPGELEYVKKQVLYSPVTIRMHAPNREVLKGTPNENHESETSLPDAYMNTNIYDYTVNNEGDIEKTKEQLDEIWKHINQNLENYYTRGEK